MIVIIVAVILSLLAAVGMADDDDEDQSGDNGDLQTFRIGYSEALTPFVVDSNGKIVEPEGSDKQFYVVRYTLANTEVSNGLNLGYYGDLTWIVNYDGVGYTSSAVSKSLPDYNPCTVKVRGQATSIVVFEVPADKTLKDLTFTVYFGEGQELVWSHALDPEAYVAEIPEIIPDVRIGWCAIFAKTVTSSKYSSWSYTAPSGWKVLLITFTLANDHYKAGVDISYNGPLDWSVIYDHRENSNGHYCCTYLAEYSAETIHIGGIGTSTAALEVPDYVSLDDLEIRVVDFWDDFTISYDDTLVQKGPSGKIRVNYSALMAEQVYDNGEVRTPSSGMRFALLTYAAINDTDRTISTSQSIWEWTLTVDGTTYNAKSYRTVGHDDHPSISPGKAGYQILVFEVPESTSEQDLSYNYSYHGLNVSIVRDRSFKTPVPMDSFYGTSVWSATIKWTDPTA